MGKKSKKRQEQNLEKKDTQTDGISETVEERFKKLLKVMSWTVGICFIIIITLPNFDFFLLDITIKIVYYIGIFNLLFFLFLELFGTNVKRFLSKRIS